MEIYKKSKLVNTTRWYRKWHKQMGIVSFAAFFVIALTGLLLIWKKNSNGYLLGETLKGKSTNAQEWVTIDSLQKSALAYLSEKMPAADPAIDRIDIRPEKGIAKVAFKNHYTAIQVDLTTGQSLGIETRRADFIEQLHDGSLFDRLLGTEFIKLVYGTLAGLLLIFLCISGFFLWYNPGKIKRIKQQKQPIDRN
jgi:uncharacterized iron-regulated membrane protein